MLARVGKGGRWPPTLKSVNRRPADQHYDHDGRDLHDPERFFAGFFDALDVLPPEVEGDGDGENDGGAVDADLGRAVEEMMNGGGESSRGRRRWRWCR